MSEPFVGEIRMFAGYAGGATDVSAVESFIQDNNTGTPTTSVSFAGGNGVLGTGTTCP